ncbi:MAG: metal-sensitive transcriptional regulator [Gemmatimonadota bacterium]
MKHAQESSDAREQALPVLNPDGLYLSDSAERALQNRLSRLAGQVQGIKRMLAEHQNCDSILIQVSALKQAVNGVAAELVAAHMESCVLGKVEAGEGREALESLRDALSQVLKHG